MVQTNGAAVKKVVIKKTNIHVDLRELTSIKLWFNTFVYILFCNCMDPKDVEELQRMIFEDDEADFQDHFYDEGSTNREYEVDPRSGDSDQNRSDTDNDTLFY